MSSTDVERRLYEAERKGYNMGLRAAKQGTCHLCGLPFTNLVEHYVAAHPKQEAKKHSAKLQTS